MNNEIDRKIAVIFVADVVGYSKHMEKDENATIRSYNACEKILNKLLKKYKGSVFNTAGDSVLAEFPSAVNAVECGVDFQNEIKKRNQSDKVDVKLEFRLGINMGDVVKKDNNLIGDGVNIAARLEALAQPNGISISKSVYDFVVPKTKMTFNDLGIQKVKQNEFHAFDILLDPSQKRKLKAKSKVNMVSLGAITALIAITIFMVFSVNQKDLPKEEVKRIKGRTLLIYDFKNLNPSKDFNYIANSLSDHLISKLTSTTLLEVVPNTMSNKFSKKEISVDELNMKHGINYIISGSTVVSKDKFRVSISLLETQKGKTLWTYNNEFINSDLFDAQDLVENEIRQTIQKQLTMGTELSNAFQRHFSTKSSYEMAIKAYIQWVKKNGKFTLDQAVPFKKLVEAYPNNPIANLFYSLSLYQQTQVNFNTYSEDKAKALETIRKASELDPTNSMILPVLGFLESVLADDTKNRTKTAFRGYSLNPANYFTLVWAGNALSRIYDNSAFEGIANEEYPPSSELYEKAIEIAPHGPTMTKILLMLSYIEENKSFKAHNFAKSMIELRDQESVFWGTLFTAFFKYKNDDNLIGAKKYIEEYMKVSGISASMFLEQLYKIPMTEWRDSTFGFVLTVMEEILGEVSQSGMVLPVDS
ncbi:hypothetical protein OA343_01680 [Paracoccaceae bacterium]|nr:hypothetical protein [Paracoccaceae bacterium]